MSKKGYIKIWRKIKDHRLWKEPRIYSRFEAWMDLMMIAAGKPNEITYRDQLIRLKRGELIIAERKLGEKWGWNRKRVHRLVQDLIENDEIRVHRRDHRFTIIYIVKYDTYNPLISDIRPQRGTTGGTTGGTTECPYKNESIKNESIKRKEERKPLARTKKKSEPKITFDFKQRKFLNIKIEDKAGWLDAYPACDIDQELRKMREWLLANPKQKKTNYRRFIANWLSRTQDKGGSRLNYDDQRKKKLDDWTKKPLEK